MPRDRGRKSKDKGRTKVVGRWPSFVNNGPYCPEIWENFMGQLHRAGKHALYHEIDSPWGHNAFMIEYGQLAQAIGDLLNRSAPEWLDA